MTTALKPHLGSPLPLGISIYQGGVNFAVYAKKTVRLCLYDPDTHNEIAVFPMFSTGKVRHLYLEGVPPEILYGYRNERGELLLDPYATATDTGSNWNASAKKYHPLGKISARTKYDWEGISPPDIPKEQLILYIMHIRGFTKDPSSGVQYPGSYLGVIEKIQHLKDLGVNAVEILPLFEFNEAEYKKSNPITKERLCNYWGYSTTNFFSPMNRYASSPEVDSAHELKDLIKTFHENGIKVILDVVYNHTGEGNEKGPVFSFKGFDKAVYYLLDEDGQYLNFSGCGNTLNCNQPIVRELILSSLRHWVTEFHVDGFRFDLASVLTRVSDGTPVLNPPLIEAISADPILADVILIAEAWDAAGLYQVGNFYPHGNRWSEWNGVYRDVVRRFIKGTQGVKGDFATKLCGSNDLYHSQGPSASVNFVVCHDGFTLADLVAYNHKHNLDNGEDNQDGNSWNDSWNCGEEGETQDPEIITLRQRQMRNFHAALLVSQGIPMLHMGDEYAHTKRGNNNTWCQDNELNWFLWDKLESNDFFNFYKFLIHFRQKHPHFHHTSFVTDKEIRWHGIKPFKPDWGDQSCFIAFELLHEQSNLYIAFNATDREIKVELPPGKDTADWHIVVNTGDAPPNDFYEDPPVAGPSIHMPGYSCLILKSTKA